MLKLDLNCPFISLAVVGLLMMMRYTLQHHHYPAMMLASKP